VHHALGGRKKAQLFSLPDSVFSNSSVRELGEIIVVDQTDTEKQIAATIS
jgi:hypothetical protein